MSVKHTMPCKTGGLVHTRHDYVADVMTRPVTRSVTASEPHNIVAARSNMPPNKDSEYELIRC